MLGAEMIHNLNNKNNTYVITTTAAATIFTLAIMTASIMLTPAAASIATNTTTTSPPPEEPGRVQLSPEPVYRERAPPGDATPINQTHIRAAHSGNGTLTLPNGTQMNTTSNGTAILSFATSSAYAKSTIRAENGETVTATIYEIIQFNNPAEAPQGGGRGIMTVIFHTNSTGMLAPLNGMILAGTDIIYPDGESDTQVWRWESGIPLSTNTTNVTTSTNTAATSETNVTTAEGND
jgi:hypothetical protein